MSAFLNLVEGEHVHLPAEDVVLRMKKEQNVKKIFGRGVAYVTSKRLLWENNIEGTFFEVQLKKIKSVKKSLLKNRNVYVQLSEGIYGVIRKKDTNVSEEKNFSWECIVCNTKNKENCSICALCGVDKSKSTKVVQVERSSYTSSGDFDQVLSGETNSRTLAVEWNCAVCTLINPLHYSRCQACGCPPVDLIQPTTAQYEKSPAANEKSVQMVTNDASENSLFTCLTLKFESGGSTKFVECLKKLISAAVSADTNKEQTEPEYKSKPQFSGISVVEDRFNERQKQISSSFDTRTRDLDSLMASVYETINMVKSIANNINSIEPGESSIRENLIYGFEECISSIGLNSEDLITPKSSKTLKIKKKGIFFNEGSYYESISDELSKLLDELFGKQAPSYPNIPCSIAVTELYLAFNLTRGKGMSLWEPYYEFSL